MIIIIRL